MSKIYYPEARIVVKATVENFSNSRGPIDFPAIPRSVRITRNSYKQPDSWSVEFDGKDFPIPPSLLRTGQVEIYLYNKEGLADRKQLRSTVKPAIVGLVDSVESSFSSDGRVVSFEGQDMTSLFAGHTFQKKRNFTNRRLDIALDVLRKEVDITNQMSLVVELPADFGVTKRQFDAGKTLTQKEKLRKLPIIGHSVSRTNRKGFPVKRGGNYWNEMYNLARKHGFILFVRDLELVLATPDGVTDMADRRTSFKLTWGKNIEQITMSRAMGKERVPQVEVISYDEKSRQPIKGVYPKKKQKVTDGVGTKRNEVLTSVLRGITDVRILERLAKAQHRLIGRSEQTIDFSTKELVDEGDENLLYLKSGDAFFLSFDPFNAEDLQKVPEGQRSEYLVKRGWTRESANLFAFHFKQLNTFKKPFYVREATIEWDKDSGMSIDVGVVNFVTVDGKQEEGEVKGAAENV